MITLFPNTWCFNVFHTSLWQSILFAEISHQAMRSAFIGSLQVRCRLARIAHAMSAHSMLQILRYDDDVFFSGVCFARGSVASFSWSGSVWFRLRFQTASACLRARRVSSHALGTMLGS